MKVLVTGPESTGGRLLARCLSVDQGLEVKQMSLPYGARARRRWPTDDGFEAFSPDAVLLTMRGWLPCRASQVGAGHVPSAEAAERGMTEALRRYFDWIGGRRWRWVIYEDMAGWPVETLAGVFEWLGRPRMCPREPITDENSKWLSAR